MRGSRLLLLLPGLTLGLGCPFVSPRPYTDEDLDGDGWYSGEDCDDQDPLTYPEASELCDGRDNDCDGEVPADEVDADRDGSRLCDGDCDDADPWTHPDAPEQCDDVDNDCDGTVDEGVHDDLDGDGFTACEGDCHGGDPSVYPDAPEGCDGVDNDCDGTSDEDFRGENIGTQVCYLDPEDPFCSDSHVEIESSLAIIDMSEWEGVTFALTVRDPDDVVFNIGDSPTNNGWAGDAATNSHDAEVLLHDTVLSIYSQDGYDWNEDILDAVPGQGESRVEVSIAPGFLRIVGDRYCLEYDEGVFPLSGHDDELGGLDDQLLHLGMNIVVSGQGDRAGSGLTGVDLYAWY